MGQRCGKVPGYLAGEQERGLGWRDSLVESSIKMLSHASSVCGGGMR